MPLQLRRPLTYLITSGETTRETTPDDEEFTRLVALIERAVAARVSLIQLREKNLSARTLDELAARSAALARGSATRILVNDRADIARASACDGVHLAANSLEPSIVRRAFGPDFIIGVSVHSLAETLTARASGADFVLFGPIFDTPSKRAYGKPHGLGPLAEVARATQPLPVIAVGGIARENIADVLKAGASGVAAIRMFRELENVGEAVSAVEEEASRLSGASSSEK